MGRRKIAKEHMENTEFPITLTTFPRLGSPDCIIPSFPVSGPKLRSQYVPDEIANPHIRFPTLAANIRSRRGRKVQVNVPVFKDENTPWPWKDPTVNYDMHNWPEDDDVRNGAAKDNFIHMDAMAFGMGSCCLQITFQAKNIEEGRKMYDQLTPLGPILLALTAATPIYKGFLADTDVRWNQISRAVDDRTPEELGEKVLLALNILLHLTNSASHSRTTDGAFQNLAMHPTPHTSLKTHVYGQNISTLISLLTRILSSASSKAVWIIC
jgi:glutamate--cysteine ligase catalytic subunit